MTSGKWDPLKDLSTVQKRMNQLFESALARTEYDTADGIDRWTPTGDVYETAEGFMLTLELPGLEQEQIDLRIDGDELVVEGHRQMEREGEQFHRVERAYGKFVRRLHLPSTVDRGAIRAGYADGLLTVRLPKSRGRSADSIRVSID